MKLTLFCRTCLYLVVAWVALALAASPAYSVQASMPTREIILDSFRHYGAGYNDLNANMGPLLGEHVTLSAANDPAPGAVGPALRLDYNLSAANADYTGLWESLWGPADDTTSSLDYTHGFREIRFWVRGTGNSNETYRVKVELKDTSAEYTRTAYRYIEIDDRDTEWRQIVLDADVTNGSFWSYNGQAPDPTLMKQLIFVVEQHSNPAVGSFEIDDIRFVVDAPPVSAGDVPIFIDTYRHVAAGHNDLNANMGPLVGDQITLTPDPSAPAPGAKGPALRVDYDLTPQDAAFTGIWESLWGEPENTTYTFDLTVGFKELRFWVKGSGTNETYNLRIELKDASGDYLRTAYTYVQIDDSDTAWREVILNADVTDGLFWQYNGTAPDPAQMKQLVFVIEHQLNPPTGRFFVDDIRWMVDIPPEPASGMIMMLDSFRDVTFGHNDQDGNKGPLIDECITLTSVPESAPRGSGGSLSTDYDFSACDDDFTGMWMSLKGDIDQDDAYLDFTAGIKQLYFWVKGNGTDRTYNLKVELKDTSGLYERTAFRYIQIDDNDTGWRKIVLDADVTNDAFWQYNSQPPDPTRMKEMVLVLEKELNPMAGLFFLDDIHFMVEEVSEPLDGDRVVMDSFRNFADGYNDLTGNMGPLNGDCISLGTDAGSAPDARGNSLKVTYDLSACAETFTGIWWSLWGNSEMDHRYLDFTKGYQQIHFWVRGSGDSAHSYDLKVELKDVDGLFEHTAFTYVRIDDSDTEWRKLVLDADVTDGAVWQYNGEPPDPTRMKELVFVLEDDFNPATGRFYVDDVDFILTAEASLSGLAYTFEDHDDRSAVFNDFNGNWGALNAENIEIPFTGDVQPGASGSSLLLNYDMPESGDVDFVGIWHSLWSHISYTDHHYLDFTDIYADLNEADKDFEQIHFWVRGSEETNFTYTHNLKVELKDANKRTAYRYVPIDDSDKEWRRIVLDADVTNENFWSYYDQPPDPTRMKELVFVLESDVNRPVGSLYIDDIQFVDADDMLFDADSASDDEFLDFVSKRTFLYFLDWYDPDTGLFQDRSTSPGLISTASTGFGLTALAIGEERGWITRSQAVEMVQRTLATLESGQTSSMTAADVVSGTNGYNGFYFHFLNGDGNRIDVGSELSPVDTALLMAGILTAREHFSDDSTIVETADRLYQRVEWDWMLFSTPDPAGNLVEKKLFYLAWRPECDNGYSVPADGGGCFTGSWDIYTDEVILLNLLAIGSPTHPVSKDTFYSWYRSEGRYSYNGQSLELTQSWPGSLFTYMFAHLWIDFSSVGVDAHPDPDQCVDWWNNTVKAALTSWQFSVDSADIEAHTSGDGRFISYGPESWGLTAAEGPPGLARYTWANDTDDPRALKGPDGGSVRNASTGYAHTSFEIDIRVADDNPHTITFYMLDWDRIGRKQMITVVNVDSGQRMSEEITEMGEGAYVTFPLQGDTRVVIERTNLSHDVINAVLSGIFFDTPVRQASAKVQIGNGDWSDLYGSDGYLLIGWNPDDSDVSLLPAYVDDMHFSAGYHAYGALPAALSGPNNRPPDHDGTIAPYGAGMAVMLKPKISKRPENVSSMAIAALRHYFDGTDAWRYRTGFGDAFNMDPPEGGYPWYNHAAFGIDQGPMLLAIENYRSDFVWDTMATNPWLIDAMEAIYEGGPPLPGCHSIFLPTTMRQ